MDIEFELRGIRFRWNSDKAHRNIEKHGIAFEEDHIRLISARRADPKERALYED